MSSNGVEGSGPEPEALSSDRARRAAATRAIAAFFAVVSLITVSHALAVGPMWVAPLQLASVLVYVAVWWLSRFARNPALPAAAVVAVVLAQSLLSSAVTTRFADVIHIAYFSSLAPFVAATTMKPPGVVLTGLAFAFGLAGQIAMHAAAPTFEAIEPYLAPTYFFALMWFVAVLASMASRNALNDHARDERRAIAAREAAREAKARYSLVAERTNDLISVLDHEDRFVYVSPSHERALGIGADDLLGRPAPELCHPDDLDGIRDALERAKREEDSAVVARVRATGESFRWFHIRLSRMNDDIDRPGAIVLSGRDVTEERALAAALESTRRMEALGRLAGGVAHDFNNLLLVIQSCTDFAASRLPADHPSAKDLGDVRRATERAAAITRQLLTFAKRQVLPLDESTRVADIVHELKPILARVAGPNTTLEVDVGGSERVVEGSSVQLEQMLMNLAANASDAMPSGGTLTIRARDETLAADGAEGLPAGRYARILVSDTGVGMTEEVRSRVFEPFFTTKSAGRGTGLGLATVFGLVSQLGGRIEVRSSEGEGTTFSVLLPEARPDRALKETAEGAAPDAVPPADSLRVLVVDDEPPVRALIARTLSFAGHAVVEASSIEEAISATEAPGARFDAIVTDVVLGSGDGIAMLDRVQTAQPDAAVVVVSGYSPSPERVADVSARGAEYLPKPFGAKELIAAITRARGARSKSA